MRDWTDMALEVALFLAVVSMVFVSLDRIYELEEQLENANIKIQELEREKQGQPIGMGSCQAR